MLIGQDRLALQSMGDIGAQEPAVADQQQALLACFGVLMACFGVLMARIISGFHKAYLRSMSLEAWVSCAFKSSSHWQAVFFIAWSSHGKHQCFRW